MSLYRVDYKHYHLEDNSWETEHDIEAESERDALLSWLAGTISDPDLNGEPAKLAEVQAETGLTLHEHFDGTVGQLVDAFLRKEEVQGASGEVIGARSAQELSFWPAGSDMDIFVVDIVALDDTEACAACRGRGRVDVPVRL